MENTSRKCSINNLPNETLTHILEKVCGDELPSRKLALVSKLWRDLLLGYFGFWTRIDISPLLPGDFAAGMCLSRRIVLSKRALLDVNVDVRNWIHSDQEDPRSNFIQFKLLCGINVSRWRSLNLVCDPGAGDRQFSRTAWTQLEKLQGSLKSLEVLQFDYPEYLPTNGRLYDLLLERVGTLRELRIITCIPAPLLNRRFLSGVAQLVCLDGNDTIRDAEPRQHFLQSWSQRDQVALSLPSKVFLARLPKGRLHLLDFSAVQSLELSDTWIRGMLPLPAAIHLPLLSKLSLVNILSDIEWLTAPLLTNLEVRGRWLPDKEWRKEADRVLRLFKDKSGKVSMDILSLTIGIPISYQALLKMVTHWSQLQHLTIDISRNKLLSWNGSFAKALIKPKQPICPVLKTLTLNTHWDQADLDAWKETVETMFKQRASRGMQKVMWTYSTGPFSENTIARLARETFTLL